MDFVSLTSRLPEPTVERLVRDLVPPREFQLATFKNYLPHTEFPSQAIALQAAANFAAGKSEKRGLFAKADSPKIGIYLDGGFGVGKTHLLASTFHAFNGIKAFGSTFTGRLWSAKSP